MPPVRPRRIWIDLDNSPHVPFFGPIVKELEARGHEVLLTTRDCFQVCALADHFGLAHRTIGRHYGANKLRKVAGTVWRTLQLAPHVMKRRPDVSLSHGSRSLVMLSSLLGIPTILLFDYEFVQLLPGFKADLGIAPAAIDGDALRSKFTQGLRHYRGLKEDVYAQTFRPDPSIISALDLAAAELVVTMRPPASEAHYHNPESNALFREAVNLIGSRRGARIIMLPRNASREKEEIRELWPQWCKDGTIVIPDRVFNGLDLVWHSDLVVSGGGTMNREAAALGVPVYSVFRGKLGAVDRALAQEGRLVLIETADDVRTKIRLVPRERTTQPPGPRTALSQIVGFVEQFLRDIEAEARAPATSRDPAAIALRLLAFCEASDWAGFDPYDALNSTLLVRLPLLDRRLPRLVLTQLLKRSPVNVRPLLGIRKTQNPKGVALFLAAILKLSKQGLLADGAERAERMVERLAALRSPGSRHWCWGYSFPWQTRTVLVPRWAPNLVCTTFVADALLDAYEATGNDAALAMARSAGEYLRDQLYRNEDGRAYFAYPLATSRTPVHNATLLAAALLCRLCACCGDDGFRAPALEAARYAVSRQRDDGSWTYGESPTQRWIDNFHTGFNLCALRAIGRNLSTGEFDASVERGFAFYVHHFFRDDGAPRYFHDRTYPVDVHAVAQSVITLVEMRALDTNALPLADAVFDWAMQNLWQPDGYFAYRRHAAYVNRIPYMRWSQAWMLVAIATLVGLRPASGREPAAGTDSRKTQVAP